MSEFTFGNPNKETKKLYPPWSNGSQYQDWMSRNCCRCTLYDDDDVDKCPLNEVMLAALADLRPWTAEDNKAVGYPETGEGRPAYTWDCPQRLLEGESRPGGSEDCEGQIVMELLCTTDTILAEIADKAFKQADIATTYALAMRSNDVTDWVAVNRAIIERWSMAGLVRVKTMAHKLNSAVAR